MRSDERMHEKCETREESIRHSRSNRITASARES